MPDALTGTTGAPTAGFNSVTGAASTTATTKAASAKPGGDLDKDAFLKLLVAQLKYQNPMSPSDPNQFLAQTAQFTMVEKLEAISKAQSDLTTWQKVSAGQALVGRQITGRTSIGMDVTGLVSGLTLSADGPELVLADGSRIPVADVTQVTAAASSLPTGATPGAATTTARTGTTTVGTTPAVSTSDGGTSASPTEAPDAATTVSTPAAPATAPDVETPIESDAGAATSTTDTASGTTGA